MRRLKVADFFCGAGGFSEGFRQKGFDIVFALDNWKPAIDTFKLNNPKCDCTLMDILDLDSPKKIDAIIPNVDVIIGSPPCVSFSNSNKSGKANKTVGIKLIKAYLRIVAWKKKKGGLKYWILENVPNSGKHIKNEYSWKELGLPGKGPALKISTKEVLNSAEFGTPQTRLRFFCGDYPTSQKTCKDSSTWLSISDVMRSLGNPLSPKMPFKVKDPAYGFSIPKKNLTDHFYYSVVAEHEWKEAKRLKEDHGFMGKMSFPEAVIRPSRTVMATRSASTRESMIFEALDDKGKRIGYRLPTIREIASFMSFPITYQFEAKSECAKYRLVGNAVCPKLSGALAESILHKEDMPCPERFISLQNSPTSFNLNGTEKKLKMPTPRKPDARFAVHIPGLKIRNFRVELNNLESDFKRKKIIWSSVLHYGTGKDAIKCKTARLDSKKIIRQVTQFRKFAHDVNKAFDKIDITAFQLQQSYSLNRHSKEIDPQHALIAMRNLVDKHFSRTEYANKLVNNEERIVNMGKDSIPLKIVASLFACNHFIMKLK